MGEFEKLVVGLGNPGAEYETTAHNLGFMVVDRLAERNGIKVGRKDSIALVGQGTVAGKKVMLAKPQTYMNESGQSVQSLLVKNEIAPGDLILVYDELDLPWQSVRIRPSGSAAGHRGAGSVIGCVGTKEFPRVRLGVHGGRREKDGAQIVLAKLKRAHRQELDELLDYASQAVESIIAEGVEKSMAKYNRRAQGLNEEE
ncbi:MAG TPA: aminoacyl-tRNA hydrolase [Bryobacteraceae bacterium]|jgi:PTH1 family peptidyl-tRNA hydrolase|nr:aminoacyl-tRNA hydrolase [Bryobacteraceae bacterium]